MCDPVSATLAIASLALTVKTYNDQVKANNKTAAVQQEQINQKASVDTQDQIKQAREERARARTAAADSGVEGNSVNALLSDIMFQSGMATSQIEKNRANGILASGMENESRNSSSRGSALSGIVQTGASSWSQYQQYKIAKDKV